MLCAAQAEALLVLSPSIMQAQLLWQPLLEEEVPC